MKKSHVNAIHRINYLNTELDSIYHRSSLKFGISDSVSMVLYAIHDSEGECLLSDICKSSGLSKQTVNSAIRSLEAQGLLYLERHDGRSKRAVPTQKGREYIEKTAARLSRAEAEAFGDWSEAEVAEYVRLTEKYIECFRRQVDEL